MRPRLSALRTAALLLAPAVVLAGCASDPTSPAAAPTSIPSASVGGDEREVRGVEPRVLLAHEAGLTLVDATTGETVREDAREGFLRLSDAGDGRRVVVADGDAFRVYDTGIERQPHGDHDHAFEYTPGLTDVAYTAAHAGHVVPHEGMTALFGDGDGSVQLVPTEQIGSDVAPVQRSTTPAPHHGVAVPVEDGLLVTDGTEEARSSIRLVRDGTEVTRTDDCAGVHGEAAAAPDADGDVVLFGCEDGPVVYRGGEFHKVPVRDDYARTGNAAGSPASPVVLTDYKVDPDADPVERTTRVALVDTRTDRLRLVDLGSSYWFRSLARGADGEGVVLTYDGSLAVLDVDDSTVERRIPVIAPWQEKDDWQQPGPVLRVVGDTAFVTDAEKKELVVADLGTGKILARHALEHTPVEMVAVTGEAPHAHAH
ncbi:hypothetical protein [Arthrobacter sp. NEB 688]|uniref:hypothetical protein n=1 Tax=Arthrobacter sp. NEB 688 TaxID=904039 RepID=UPI00256FB380|nr:hypothetical protein [Arthrobacter sp. NEB 688]